MGFNGAHLLFDTIWYGHILHRNQLCKVCQAVHILDFLTEFGAVKRRGMKCQDLKVNREDLYLNIPITLHTEVTL